ncbi:hypothetical protein NS506_03996 [Nocardia seriolae]|uniref:LigA n=1 Tax=Nocardia seriolae TaxID=37332 RepID=A0ABC8AVK8_9NOCA|nr:hypothetical protein NS506_03996 [Nocardia seriolae]
MPSRYFLRGSRSGTRGLASARVRDAARTSAERGSRARRRRARDDVSHGRRVSRRQRSTPGAVPRRRIRRNRRLSVRGHRGKSAAGARPAHRSRPNPAGQRRYSAVRGRRVGEVHRGGRLRSGSASRLPESHRAGAQFRTRVSPGGDVRLLGGRPRRSRPAASGAQSHHRRRSRDTELVSRQGISPTGPVHRHRQPRMVRTRKIRSRPGRNGNSVRIRHLPPRHRDDPAPAERDSHCT